MAATICRSGQMKIDTILMPCRAQARHVNETMAHVSLFFCFIVLASLTTFAKSRARARFAASVAVASAFSRTNFL